MALRASIDADGIEECEALLEGLVRLDLAQLRRGLAPPIYQSGVRYEREPRGHEQWQTAVQANRTKRADCEDLSAWLAASYRLVGVDAACVVRDVAPGLKHVVVQLPDGSIEDPSARLGMRGKG